MPRVARRSSRPSRSYVGSFVGRGWARGVRRARTEGSEGREGGTGGFGERRRGRFFGWLTHPRVDVVHLDDATVDLEGSGFSLFAVPDLDGGLREETLERALVGLLDEGEVRLLASPALLHRELYPALTRRGELPLVLGRVRRARVELLIDGVQDHPRRAGRRPGEATERAHGAQSRSSTINAPAQSAPRQKSRREGGLRAPRRPTGARGRRRGALGARDGAPSRVDVSSKASARRSSARETRLWEGPRKHAVGRTRLLSDMMTW